MSAIDDIDRAKQNTYGGVWSWEPHGDGWALYVDRGEPIDLRQPRGFGNEQHGYNILTVNRGGFDRYGEDLRAFILEAGMKAGLLVAERAAERKAWARLLRAQADLCENGGSMCPDCDDEGNAREVAWASAKQALRDLGVDVDALVTDPVGPLGDL